MQRFLRFLFVTSFLLIPVTVGVGSYLLIGFHSDEAGPDFNEGKNGIWLGHTWVEDEYSEEALMELGNTLTANEIRYAYVHAGPIGEDGEIGKDRYPEATDFLAFMHENFPEIEWYAWLGQVRALIDLEDQGIRENIAASAKALVESTGFEGVHYDIEPIRPDDTGFLALLDETRAQLPGVPISVAADEWQPKRLSDWAAGWFNVEIVSYWPTELLEEVMPRVDQVVIMGYDTSLSSPEWYRWFLEQQVIYVSKIADDTGTDLLIGIPSYDGGLASDPVAENVENGLHGIIQGLTNTRSRPDAVKGIVIYAYWEMDETEWDTYNTLWLGSNSD